MSFARDLKVSKLRVLNNVVLPNGSNLVDETTGAVSAAALPAGTGNGGISLAHGTYCDLFGTNSFIHIPEDGSYVRYGGFDMIDVGGVRTFTFTTLGEARAGEYDHFQNKFGIPFKDLDTFRKVSSSQTDTNTAVRLKDMRAPAVFKNSAIGFSYVFYMANNVIIEVSVYGNPDGFQWKTDTTAFTPSDEPKQFYKQTESETRIFEFAPLTYRFDETIPTTYDWSSVASRSVDTDVDGVELNLAGLDGADLDPLNNVQTFAQLMDWILERPQLNITRFVIFDNADLNYDFDFGVMMFNIVNGVRFYTTGSTLLPIVPGSVTYELL